MNADLESILDAEIVDDHLPAVVDRAPATIDINHSHTPSAERRLENSGRENTRSTYESQWRQFAAWCTDTGRDPRVPTTPHNMAGYTAHLMDKGAPPSSVRLAAAAVRWVNARAGHPDAPDMAETMQIYRDHRYEWAQTGRGQKSSAPIHLPRLRAMVAACDPNTDSGKRDRALLLLGYHMRARASELAALRVGDIDLITGNLMVATKRVSKNDKDSSGREYEITDPACIAAVRTWLTTLDTHGQRTPDLPLLRGVDQWGNIRRPSPKGWGLSRQSMNTLVQQIAERAGIVGADDQGDLAAEVITAHGLRAGVPTDLGRLGKTAAEIKEITGDWASLEIVEKYRKVGRRMAGVRGDESHRAQALDMLRLNEETP